MRASTALKKQPTAGTTQILLVDDNPDALQSMVAVLESLGEELLTAGNADEALKHLLRCVPAVIVLDVMMPEVNGFELAGIIRQRDKFRNVPIIFLTGMGREDRRHENNHFHSMDYRNRRRAGELFRPHILRCCNPPPDKSPGRVGQGNREASYRELA